MKIRSAILTVIMSLLLIKSYAQINYEDFSGKKVKVYLVREFKYSNLYDYSLNSINGDSLINAPLNFSSPERVLVDNYRNKLSQNNGDSIVFQILLKSRLIVKINNELHFIIKYKVIDNQQLGNNFQFIDIVRKDSTLYENKITSDELEIFKSILDLSSVSLLFDIFNGDDYSKIPELKKIQKSVHDSNGNLNIEKLEKILKDKQSVLKKYVD